MLRIGLTGGIGSGKTSVSDRFAKLGIPVIDTDVIAHELVDKDPGVLQAISNTFGEQVLMPGGGLNRKILAQIVFNDKESKQLLERLLHPRIEDEVNQQVQHLISSNTQPDYAIIVVPLLIEANYHGLVDRILVVTADEQKRIERVQQRDNRSLDEIHAIISNQVDEGKRQSEADDIIENSSNIKNLDVQIKKLHEKYKGLAGALK